MKTTIEIIIGAFILVCMFVWSIMIAINFIVMFIPITLKCLYEDTTMKQEYKELYEIFKMKTLDKPS